MFTPARLGIVGDLFLYLTLQVVVLALYLVQSAKHRLKVSLLLFQLQKALVVLLGELLILLLQW